MTQKNKAVISGIGISQIGRKTENTGLELTAESSAAAIADAGLTAADIDGVSTMGETPVPQACERLGIQADYQGGGYSLGGLLTQVMAAAEAVEAGRAKHVLVYRTVKMMDGSMLSRDGGGGSSASTYD
jgi:acetyl-CoA acetyltransferase